MFLSSPLTFFSPLGVFYSSLFSVSVSIGFMLVELVIIMTESSITSGFYKRNSVCCCMILADNLCWKLTKNSWYVMLVITIHNHVDGH